MVPDDGGDPASESDRPATKPDPHADQPIETAGAPPAAAESAVVLLHGRGSTAGYMLTLVDEFLHHGAMYLAPQAAHRSWYPRPVGAPREANEPWLSSGVRCVARAFDVAAGAGVPPERTLLLGFSQGACLACEFVVRRPRRYGGLVVLSGGLPGAIDDREAAVREGDLDGTPVVFGCDRDDPYITVERVEASASAFRALGGDVDVRLYDDLGHAINDDEIAAIDGLVGDLVDAMGD